MLDAAFWWCATVALVGSAGLVAVALLAGRSSRSYPAGTKLHREEHLMVRHFGRA